MDSLRNTLIVLVTLAGTGTTSAHDLRVLGSRLESTKPTLLKTTIYLSWGHALPVDDLVTEKSLQRYELLTPSGKTKKLATQALSLQANAVILEEAGVYQAVAERVPTLLAHFLDAEGNKRFRLGGRAAVQEGKVLDALRSRQGAKVILVNGGGLVRPVGLPMEIVPLEPTAHWRAGKAQRFQVLFEGKPLAGVQVQGTFLGRRPAEGYAGEEKTDAKGVVSIVPGTAGTWVFRAAHRYPGPAERRSDYDEESVLGTTTLEILP